MFSLTPAGVKLLQLELERLVAERGPIAERIVTAREFGDLSENAEYTSARQEQERVESRIAELDHILKNVKLIKEPHKNDVVRLGSTVSLEADSVGSKEFKVVGTVEADPLKGRISDESPLGQALLGKAVGDKVEVRLPAKVVDYTIVRIS